MRLNITIVAAALALGCAGQASAAYDLPNTGSSVLLFSAWDPTTGASYTRGLGHNYNDFTPALASGLHVDLNLMADPNFTTAFGTTLSSSLLWNVVEADNIKTDTGAGAGVFRVAFTTAPGVVPTAGPPPNVTIPNVSGSGNNMNFFLSQVNTGCASVTGNAGSCASTLATDAFNINNGSAKWGSTLGGILGISTAGAVGDTLSFFELSATAAGGKGTPTITQFIDDPLVWKLSSSGALTFTVAAIPEPSSWLLMGVGLLAVGSIARRRLS